MTNPSTSGLAGRGEALPSPDTDGDLDRVRRWLIANDPDGKRFARVLRESLDQVLDGPRTGRFRYSDLRKTEKTHVGTIVEINLAKEFGFQDGAEMDYQIAGVQVDCKYSMSRTGWAIPLEAIGHIVLLTWADDDNSKWSVGLWRVDPKHLNQGNNRDRKRTISATGRVQIQWLWREAGLDENLLLHLDAEKLNGIFSHEGKRKGQKRVNELFRRVQGRIIRREVVLTVAQQKDGPRRARMAREPKQLGREGIIVLGHYSWDVQIAKTLGLPVPKSGEWVSVRIAPVTPESTRPKFPTEDGHWAIWTDGDPVAPAPVVPRGKPLDDE
ncbi:NaeI family type II restriction endonuclease [Lentzea chajnantorensis]